MGEMGVIGSLPFAKLIESTRNCRNWFSVIAHLSNSPSSFFLSLSHLILKYNPSLSLLKCIFLTLYIMSLFSFSMPLCGNSFSLSLSRSSYKLVFVPAAKSASKYMPHTDRPRLIGIGSHLLICNPLLPLVPVSPITPLTSIQ